MVGHDIRNPLAVITGAVYLAKDELANFPEGESKEEIKYNLDLIDDQTVYMNKIVADLQDYARPLHPNIENTNLEQVVKSVLAELKLPQNIRVACPIKKNLTLKTDAVYLKRILTNLITNAVQAMPKGGKLIIKASRKRGSTIISVEDTGVGIPEAVKSHLFTPLVTTKARGHGFGLAVVKRLTEALDGKVWFESEVGKGTKFAVELPLLPSYVSVEVAGAEFEPNLNVASL
jgi:signal transduction histidine kinase